MTHHTTTQHDGQRALEADIARQRDELAHTVDDLRDKLDVKHRAQERAHEMKWTAQERAHELKDRATTERGNPQPALIAACVAAAAVPIVWLGWKYRRAIAVPTTGAMIWGRLHRKESK